MPLPKASTSPPDERPKKRAQIDLNDESIRLLNPVANRKLRWIVLAVLLIPVALTWRGNIVLSLLSALLPIVLTGTYRISFIRGSWFETRFYLGYVPVSRARCKLPAVTTLIAVYRSQTTSPWVFLLFGPLQFILSHVFDYLLPVLGGAYELWLVTAKGREILAWSGTRQEWFEENRDLLQHRTSAELQLR